MIGRKETKGGVEEKGQTGKVQRLPETKCNPLLLGIVPVSFVRLFLDLSLGNFVPVDGKDNFTSRREREAKEYELANDEVMSFYVVDW